MKRVGVCIVTLRAKDNLLTCLKSVYENSSRLNLEIVVVDNNSQDGTLEDLNKEFPFVKVIANSKNVGYSRAVNQGMKIIQSEYLMLLNPDTFIEKNAVEVLVKFMDLHPDAGICSPKVLNQDGSFQYQCRRGEARPGEVFFYFLGFDRLFPNNPRFNGYLLRHLDNDVINEVKAVSGSCMVIRRAVIEQIGYLDELYFAYQEDTDYCFRARHAGWKIYYVPMATTTHLGGRGGSSVNPYFGVYQWHRSYYLYYRKNLARDYPFFFHPFYYLVMLAKLGINLLTVLFSREKIVGTRKPS